MGALDGKVAVITGSTSGIAARTAELFLPEGTRGWSPRVRRESPVDDRGEKCGSTDSLRAVIRLVNSVDLTIRDGVFERKGKSLDKRLKQPLTGSCEWVEWGELTARRYVHGPLGKGDEWTAGNLSKAVWVYSLRVCSIPIRCRAVRLRKTGASSSPAVASNSAMKADMLPLLSLDESARLAEKLRIARDLGTSNVFRGLLHSSSAAGGLYGLLDALMFHNKVQARMRELVILRIGWHAGSEYVFCNHVRISRQLGLRDEEILGVRDPQRCGAYSGADRVVLRLADELHEYVELTHPRGRRCERHSRLKSW
jgi:Carboxymuconolactone decarboxylase family